MSEVSISRVNLSLPCTVPVLPGTPITEAAISKRTETCSIDAFWVVGIAPICDLHLAAAFGEEFYTQALIELEEDGFELGRERGRHSVPWELRYRYPQDHATLPDSHPLKEAGPDGT